MAKDHADIVKRGLKLKKIGNDIVNLLGGREIHPINVRVGGFYRLPTKAELDALIDSLKWGIDASHETIEWVASLPFPDFERDYEFVSLRHPDEYPMCEGRIVSNKGIDIPLEDFYKTFEEIHVKHSTSLQSVVKGRGEYFTGPNARFNNNFDRLPSDIQKAAQKVGLDVPCPNPFKSIIIRSLETLYAFHEAIRVIESYTPPGMPYIEVTPRKATAYGASEAPRGLLFHQYQIDSDGIIQNAHIVPPTSQNQQVMESDLVAYVNGHLDLPQDELTWRCEQVIRNYDPCISCSCHFLRLKIDRE
jgi:coenzyme F420-reducing hydrogenase alpha subunit